MIKKENKTTITPEEIIIYPQYAMRVLYQMKRKQKMLKLNLNKRYLTLSLFMAALMLCVAEPAFADDVSTKTTGFYRK